MSTELWQRLKAARQFGNLTQQQIADVCGVTRSAVAQWEAGDPNKRTAPNYTHLLAVAKQTGAPLDWLLDDGSEMDDSWMQRVETEGGEVKSAEAPNTAPGPDVTGEVPLISWVQAGAWEEVHDPYAVGDYEKLIPVTRRYSERAYALRIQGDSMQAPDGHSFPSGSIIIVEPLQEPKNGSYVIVRLEDEKEATFKKLVIDGDRRYLRPLNPRYPILEVKGEATFAGVVRQLVMDFD